MSAFFRTEQPCSAQNFAEIHISGGQRGLNLSLAPNDLVELTRARFAQISVPWNHAAEA